MATKIKTRKTKTHILITAIAIAMAAVSGCDKPAPATGAAAPAPVANSESKPAPPAAPGSTSGAQSNSNSQVEKPAQSSETSSEKADPAKLIGRYEMVQVQKGGVISMISDGKVEITFSPEGSYTRISKLKDKPIHDDHGQYRIENGDELILTIQVSKKTIHNPPLVKTHKISLSRDGEELKMISEKGDVAVFKKAN